MKDKLVRVIEDEARLQALRRTSLLEALEANPSLSNDQRRRLRELRETFRIGAQGPPPPAAAPSPEPEPHPAAAEPLVEAPRTEHEALATYLSDEEQQEEEKINTVQKIYRMNTAEKLLAALKGNREERAILVRDPNRLVALAALGSPRLTEPEIEAFSAMKNISDQILREIGKHREWTKKYQVVSNLVKNPRTPIAISMGLVSRLSPRDMKAVTVDKNVPEAIRKAAKKFVREPGEGTRR